MESLILKFILLCSLPILGFLSAKLTLFRYYNTRLNQFRKINQSLCDQNLSLIGQLQRYEKRFEKIQEKLRRADRQIVHLQEKYQKEEFKCLVKAT